MTWKDFLRYTKYIGVFYAIAFALTLVGIWSTDPKFVYSGLLFAGAAVVANVALGFYHSNHKQQMRFEKNLFLAEQEGSMDITGSEPAPAVVSSQQRLQEGIRELTESEVAKALRNQRGY